MSCFNGEKCREMRDDWLRAVLGGQVITAAKITVEGAKEMAASVKENLTPEKPKPPRKRKAK